MYLCSSRGVVRQPTRKETNFRWWNAAGIVVFARSSLLWISLENLCTPVDTSSDISIRLQLA